MKINNTPCPWCGSRTLHIGDELQAKPVGTFSLSGAQFKVSAYTFPVLTCQSCDLSVDGTYIEGEAVFDIPDKEVKQ